MDSGYTHMEVEKARLVCQQWHTQPAVTVPWTVRLQVQ